MSERIPEQESAHESESNREELKRAVDKADHESGKDHDPHDQERSVEVARDKLRRSAERPAEREKKQEPKPTQRKRLVSAAERTGAYKAALHDVQRQLPPLQRNFSRVVHARFIEETSELLEETIYRPSFLLSGGIGALVVGSLFYIVARTQGWLLSGSEFTVSLLIGGILGWIGESLVKRFRKK